MKTIPKLHLSKQETALVSNTEWILTKHEIIKKIYNLFGELHEIIKDEATASLNLFPPNIIDRSGKISKGENYLGLPYLILDQPATFEKNNLFAVRTMFWWGNFFSVTLHLSGTHKVRLSNVPQTFSFLKEKNFFICVNEDEWQHHFDASNYVPAENISIENFKKIMERNFFKVSKKISASEMENAPDFLVDTFKEIVQLLQINYRDDKKDLSLVFPKAGSGL